MSDNVKKMSFQLDVSDFLPANQEEKRALLS